MERRLLPLPDRGTAYELTGYGPLEPILLALGRWGTRSMGQLPGEVVTRSRWLVAAMLAFHDSRRVARPTTWELRLSDGVFTVRAEGTSLTVAAGAPERAEVVGHDVGCGLACAADAAGDAGRRGRLGRGHARR